MNQFKVLIDILNKFRFYRPIEKKVQKKIFKAKKRSLKKIIHKADKTHLAGTKVSFYYRLRAFGIVIRLTTSFRLINTVVSALGVIFILSAALIVYNYFKTATTTTLTLGDTKGTVTFVLGKVNIGGGGAASKQARVKGRVKKGDLIKTGPHAYVSLQFSEDKVMAILPESKVAISSTHSQNNEFNLVQGTILSKLGKLGKGEKYQVRTRNAVAVIRGTWFRVSYQASRTIISVAQGSVKVKLIDANNKILSTKIINKGCKSIITDSITVKKNNRIDSLILKQISPLNYINNFDGIAPVQLTRQNKTYQNYLHTIEQKILFQKGKKMYGHLYTIILYNGRVIRGYIKLRGSKWQILTNTGFISIPGKMVKKIK